MTQRTDRPGFSTLRSQLAGLVSTAALMAAAPVLAQDCRLIDGVLPEACQQPNKDVVVTMPAEPNQERVGETVEPGGTGFSISRGAATIAGQPRERIAGESAATGPTRAQDLTLDASNVQVKYDGIRDERRLNVVTGDLRTEFIAGEAVTFRASSN
jgi:hypothetical protein